MEYFIAVLKNKERKNNYIQKMPVNDLFLTMYSE